MSTATSSNAACSICYRVYDAGDLDTCRCGDLTCWAEDCPSYGCSCVDPDPITNGLRVSLRATARELIQLNTEQELFGCISVSQQERRTFLSGVVTSLRAEVHNRLDTREDYY